MLSNKSLRRSVVLSILMAAFRLQSALAFEEISNITLTSHGVLLINEKQLKVDGFDVLSDDTFTQLTPLHDGWVGFTLPSSDTSDIVFPDGSILPLDEAVKKNELIFWFKNEENDEINTRFSKLTLSSDLDPSYPLIVSINGKKVRLNSIQPKAPDDTDYIPQYAKLKLEAVIITSFDDTQPVLHDQASSQYSEYSDSHRKPPHNKKSDSFTHSNAQLPLFNILDAFFDSAATSMGDSWLTRGGSNADFQFKLPDLSLSKRLYLDNIVTHQTFTQGEVIQVNMLFSTIMQDAATPDGLDPLAIIMNWLAEKVTDIDDMYAVNRKLLEKIDGHFQSKETFKDNYTHKNGKLKTKKLLQSWKDKCGEGLAYTLKAVLKKMHYDFTLDIASAFEAIAPQQDMIQGGSSQPLPKKKPGTSNQSQVVHQISKTKSLHLPGVEMLDSASFYSTASGGEQVITGPGIRVSGLPSNIEVTQAVSDISKVQPERKLGKDEKPEWPAFSESEDEDEDEDEDGNN